MSYFDRVIAQSGLRIATGPGEQVPRKAGDAGDSAAHPVPAMPSLDRVETIQVVAPGATRGPSAAAAETSLRPDQPAAPETAVGPVRAEASRGRSRQVPEGISQPLRGATQPSPGPGPVRSPPSRGEVDLPPDRASPPVAPAAPAPMSGRAPGPPVSTPRLQAGPAGVGEDVPHVETPPDGPGAPPRRESADDTRVTQAGTARTGSIESPAPTAPTLADLRRWLAGTAEAEAYPTPGALAQTAARRASAVGTGPDARAPTGTGGDQPTAAARPVQPSWMGEPRAEDRSGYGRRSGADAHGTEWPSRAPVSPPPLEVSIGTIEVTVESPAPEPAVAPSRRQTSPLTDFGMGSRLQRHYLRI